MIGASSDQFSISAFHLATPQLTALAECIEASLPQPLLAASEAAICAWPGYAATPLLDLAPLANHLGIGQLAYKDESKRFHLGSFKALGGAYAVQRMAEDLNAQHAAPSQLHVAAATDGNHGRSVAWGAQRVGAKAHIFIHAGVSQGRADAIAAFGADVIRVAGNYDASLEVCAARAAAEGWRIVSDTSWPGYEETPKQVMAGYGVMAREAMRQWRGAPPSHVLIQAGVGGLAAAVIAALWQAELAEFPKIIIVEADRAACVLQSARAGAPTPIDITCETIMAGLSCGEVSMLAWPIINAASTGYLAIPDSGIAPVMALLASGRASADGRPIEAGESAVPALAALLALKHRPALAAQLELDSDARVLVLGSEGATDPELYQRLLNDAEHG